MRIVIPTVVVAGLMSSAAYAADKPAIGPAPAWVRPLAAPPAPAKADEAAVRVLLSDQQVRLEAGRQTVYSEVALKIQTPQGLAAGNISLPWRPDTDVLTVHKLLIRRGGEVVDVLASGQTFTVVRRETNLESATLDGVLTANIQPEGLQVGDVLEFAASVASSDPVMKGHVEQLAGAWNGAPIGRAHLRMEWPSSIPARVRQTAALPALKPVAAGDTTSVELTLDNLQPIIPPKGAPMRYGVGRLIELTDFASWADLGAMMAPLYRTAAVLPAEGPLKTELERIRVLSPDPKRRAEAALALVQDRVRYVALAMGAGGLVPADAATTWSRRYGDCKGKTALLLALLGTLDIPAEPVAVSTLFGDGLDRRLPMVGVFNHVLVRATVAGRTYWLDGTRTGDTGLDRLATPAFGWGLPLVPTGATLVRMVPAPLDRPAHDTTIRMDATAGLTAPAPTRVETILRGDEAIGTTLSLANLAGEARDRALREYWKGQYDFIDIKSVGASFDPGTGEQRLTMEGDARMDWGDGDYETDGTGVGYRADFRRDPGPDQDAPFAVPYPYYTRTEQTILLPKDFGEFKLGTGVEVDQTVAGIYYRRHAAIAGNVFTIEKTERSVAPEFAAKDAPAAQIALRTLADRPAKLHRPLRYEPTDKDIAAARVATPTSAYEFFYRGRAFAERDFHKEALLDYDKAIELDPNAVWACANRAMTKVETGDLAGARSDIAKGELLDPDSVQLLVALGMLADAEHRPRDAVAIYSKILKAEPDAPYALRQRAMAYAALGDHDRAAADLTAQIAVDPGDASAYVARAATLLDRGRLDEASKDLDAAHAMNPRSAAMFRTRGMVARRKGAHKDAVAAHTTALEIEPGDPFTLSERAEAYRALGDDDAALRDTAAVLKLNPDWPDLYLLRANILRGQGKRDEALAEAAAVVAASPDNAFAHVIAANIYAAFDRRAEALGAFDRALAIKPEAYIYLNRAAARSKAELAARRADVDAALKLEPRLGEALAAKAALQVEASDLAGAIATYTAAIAAAPDQPALLANRGVAHSRAGDQARAAQDFAAARAKATDAPALNNICWSKATAGVALESALADCDAALAKMPDAAAFRDSRALVLLRLGRLDDAVADYDKALATAPTQSSSLFGRAVARARKGDRAGSDADADAAAKADPKVQQTFEGYGVRR